MSFTKLCTVCGTQFEGRTRQDKYCSDECRRKQKNLTTKEYVLAHKTIEKVCENCGELFMTHREATRFCSRSCAGSVQKVNSPDGAKVRIRIKKHIPVHDHMMPKVGQVYEAIKRHDTQYVNTTLYIIPGIGKYGLLIRSDECEEVIE